MNLIQVAGHLGGDPESRFTPSGLKVTTLRLAAKTRRRNKKDQNNQGDQGQGQGQNPGDDADDTIWWRVTVWGDKFDKMFPYLKKGSAIIVIGEMHKPELWTNREGVQQINVELTADIIKFSPFGRSGEKQDGGEARQSYGQPQPSHANSNYGQPNYGVEEFSSGQRNAPFSGTQQAMYGQKNSNANTVEEEPPF